MHLSMKHSLFFSLLFFFFKSFETKLFELHSLPHGYLTYLGDSHPQYVANANAITIALTKEGMPTDAPESSGTVFYSRPLSFLNMVPSFSTMFAFSIRNIYGDKGDFGDGLAFLISAEDNLLGSPGYLGLVDSRDLTRNKFIAIEFDTKCDPMFQDPDDNHLGLDINSLSSVQTATASSSGVDLKSGDLIRSWIDYKSDEKRLEVFLSYSSLKPKTPLLKVDINLSNFLKENMFVGFSAATKRSTQLTCIEQWEFTIVGSSPPPPPSSPPESVRNFPNPSKTRHESGHRYSHLSMLVIGLTVGVCSVSFILGFCWFCWKNLMGVMDELEGTNNLEGQTIMSSGGTSEIRLSLPNTNADEVGRGLIIEKMLDNKAKLIRVKTVKFIIPLTATFCLH